MASSSSSAMTSSSSSAMTSLKEAKKDVVELKAKADKLQAKVDKLQAKVDKLQAEVKELASDPSTSDRAFKVADQAWRDAKEARRVAKQAFKVAEQDWRDAKNHQRMLERARGSARSSPLSENLTAAQLLRQQGDHDFTAVSLPTLKAAVIPAQLRTNVEATILKPDEWVQWTLDEFRCRAVGSRMVQLYYSTDGSIWRHAEGDFRAFLEYLVRDELKEGCKSSKSEVTAHLWLWPDSVSPPPSPPPPTEEKFPDPRSVQHLRQFYKGCTVFQSLTHRFSRPREPDDDLGVVLLFAVPGAGKTRTVREAAVAATCKLLRIRLCETNPTLGAVDRDDPSLLAQLKVLSGTPRQVREAAVSMFADYWKRRLSGLVPAQHKGFVLHFDECQELMTDASVWHDDQPAPRDCRSYHLAGLMQGANQLVLNDQSLAVHVVFSGTNAWAPLVLKGTSAIKPFTPPLLSGTLPVDWVMKTLLPAYVKDVDPLWTPVVRSLSHNRRHIRNLVTELFEAQQHQKEQLDLTQVKYCAEQAVEQWSIPVLRTRASIDAMGLRALALVMFPAAFHARQQGNAIVVKKLHVDPAVAEFARAGGLNVATSDAFLRIQIPQGALMEFLLERTRNAIDAGSEAQLKSFVTVALTNVPEKGHAFERMLACEATLLSSQFVDVVAQQLKLEGFVVDPRAIGRPFEYAARIYEAMHDDKPRVFCVDEKMNVQDRLVDVGIPLWHPSQGTWKVYFELKFVSERNTLWKQCATFFDKMKQHNLVGAKQRASAVFLSMTTFTKHKPKQAPSKTRSAHDARIDALKMGPHFLILEMDRIPKNFVQFPLHDVLSYASRILSRAPQYIYTGGTPIKK